MASDHLHEDLSRDMDEKKSGERGLGITFAAVLLVVGLLRRHASGVWEPGWFAAAAAFLLLAFFWLAPLRPLNALWHRLGLLLGSIFNPVLMTAVFFLVVYPVGLILRWAGKDPLRLKLDRSAASYWQAPVRSEAFPPSMSDQF